MSRSKRPERAKALLDLFEELMGVEDATPEFERLESELRAALQRGVAIEKRGESLLAEAEEKAWKSLAQGKYSQFGYWGAKVVQFRELLGKGSEPSPFRGLRVFAAGAVAAQAGGFEDEGPEN